MVDFKTKEQSMAQKAFLRVSERQAESDFGDYKSFALSFPSLIHTCGLVQAVSFACSKKKKKSSMNKYVEDLQAVFNEIDNAGDLATRSREAMVMEYMRISRHALSAASWIKRYCQAAPDKKEGEKVAELS